MSRLERWLDNADDAERQMRTAPPYWALPALLAVGIILAAVAR